MELPELLGLLGITRITLELLSKSGITELLDQVPSNSGLVTSLTRYWKPLGHKLQIILATALHFKKKNTFSYTIFYYLNLAFHFSSSLQSLFLVMLFLFIL